MLVCKVFKSDYLNNGKVFYQIDESNQNINIEINEEIILYLATKDGNSFNIFMGKIDRVESSEKYINIYYTLGKELQISSREFSNKLYAALLKNNVLANKDYIPNIVKLSINDYNYIINIINRVSNKKIIKATKDINELKLNNNWVGINSLFGNIYNLENNLDIWNDSKILGEIAFATSKLAQCGSIPKDIRRDKKQKSKFLERKKEYRDEVEFLFNRVLQLEPNKSTYLSAFAYYRYSNILDLSLQGGRDDGNLAVEINEFYDYINLAIKSNPRSIKDYYRKGYILIRKDAARYITIKDEEEGNLQYKNLIKEGIKNLDIAISLWNELDEKLLKEKKRCKSEIIKALYNKGRAYENLYYNYWNEMVYKSFLNNESKLITANVEIPNKHINYLRESINAFNKCWELSYGSRINRELDINDINRKSGNWPEEAADIIYRIGLINLHIYYAIMNDSRYSESKKKKYEELAEYYLKFASKVNCQNNWQVKQKAIKEKLARLYIGVGKYEEAIKVIKAIKSKGIDDYISNTLAIAYYYNGEYEKAIETLINIHNNKYNKVKLYSKIILISSYIKLNNSKAALNIFKDIKDRDGIQETSLVKMLANME